MLVKLHTAQVSTEQSTLPKHARRNEAAIYLCEAIGEISRSLLEAAGVMLGQRCRAHLLQVAARTVMQSWLRTNCCSQIQPWKQFQRSKAHLLEVVCCTSGHAVRAEDEFLRHTPSQRHRKLVLQIRAAARAGIIPKLELGKFSASLFQRSSCLICQAAIFFATAKHNISELVQTYSSKLSSGFIAIRVSHFNILNKCIEYPEHECLACALQRCRYTAGYRLD